MLVRERQGTHGTVSRYTSGCRCDDCRAVIADKKRAYREKNRAAIADYQRAYYEKNRAVIGVVTEADGACPWCAVGSHEQCGGGGCRCCETSPVRELEA